MKDMARPRLNLYVDAVSPFGYLAYYVTRHSPIFKTCEITYVPIFLGGLMKANGNRPPAEIKNKAAWLGRERLRWSALFNIPTTRDMPNPFPFPTLQIQRIFTALQIISPDSLPIALDAIFASIWVEGNTASTNDAAYYGPIIEGALGKELAERVREVAGGQEAKDRLQQNTDRAFEVGAFGLPWFECTRTSAEGVEEREGFWGFDHLGVVVRFLGLGDGQGRDVESGLVEGMKALL